MADVDLTFGGDGSPVKKAWQMSAEGCAEFINEVKKIVGASNEADRAQAALGKTADRWLKQMETPFDAHLRRFAELQRLLQAGLIDQNQYTKGIALSVTEMKEAESAADSLGAAAKRIVADQQTPQDQYNAKLALLSQLLKENKLDEQQYGQAVAQAKAELDSKDVSLQRNLSNAAKIKASAVTPEQQHGAAIANAKDLLEKKLITQREYDLELNKQNRLLREAKAAQTEFLSAGQKATASMTQSLEGFAVKVLGVQAAYHGVLQTVRAVVSEHSKFNESIQKTIDLTAHEELKLQIKSGVLPSQIEEKMPQVQKALMETPVTDLAGGLMIQAQIESSGYSQKDIDSGKALENSLAIKAATNGIRQGGGDINKATKSMSQFLKAQGIATPNADDILRVGKKMTALFKVSEVEFESLAALAENAATLSGFGLTESELLSGFSTGLDQLGDEKSGSGFRMFVSRTATAGNDKTKLKALTKAGLKPEDIAIAKGGKQLIPTLKLLREKLSKMSEVEQNIFLDTVYGEQGAAFARTALNPEMIAQIEERIALQADESEFNRNVASFRGSREARNTRTRLTTDFNNRKIDKERGGTTWKEAREAQEAQRAQMQADGSISGTRRALGATFANWVWNPVAEGLGFDPPTVEQIQSRRIKGDANSPIEQAINANSRGQADVADRETQRLLEKQLAERLGDVVLELRENTKITKENSEATKKNTEKPPAKRPASAPTKTPVSAGLAKAT